MNIVRSKHNKQVFKLPNWETGLFSLRTRVKENATQNNFLCYNWKKPSFSYNKESNGNYAKQHTCTKACDLICLLQERALQERVLVKSASNISSLKKSASWKFQNINSQLSRNVIIDLENFIKF